MIFLSQPWLNQRRIVSEFLYLSFHMFWRVNGNSGKAAGSNTRTGQAFAGLKSAIAKTKSASSETEPESSEMDSASSKLTKAFAETISASSKLKEAFAETISAPSKVKKASSEMVLASSEMKKASSKMISEDGFGAKNVKKPGFLRAAGTGLNAIFNETG